MTPSSRRYLASREKTSVLLAMSPPVKVEVRTGRRAHGRAESRAWQPTGAAGCAGPAPCRVKQRARRGPREAWVPGVRGCTLSARADRERRMATLIGPALAAQQRAD